MGDRWERDEDTQLRQLIADGKGGVYIGKELGRSEKSVYHRVMKLGLRPPKLKASAQSRTWSTDEDSTLARLIAEQRTTASISRILRRSMRGVQWRILKLRLRQPRPRSFPSAASPPLPRAFVPHGDVPRWYVLGWRFAGFEDGLCIFEWPCSGEPRWPVVKVEQRELEAA